MVAAGRQAAAPGVLPLGRSSAPAVTPTTRRVIDAGAAFELMHAFALFHDDVMDDAGQPAWRAHHTRRLRRRARREGWAGEPRRFGEGVAILVGDLAFVLADQLLVGAPAAVWRLWNELRIELNVGQFLDLLGSVQGERRLDKAERIARYKSGKYTSSGRCTSAPLLAAPERGRRLLAGAESLTGCRSATPSRCATTSSACSAMPRRHRQAGRRRPPRGQADAAARPRRRRGRRRRSAPCSAASGAADLDADEIARIQQVIVDTGALGELERTVADLADVAIRALTSIDITDEARGELAALADFVATRGE